MRESSDHTKAGLIFIGLGLVVALVLYLGFKLATRPPSRPDTVALSETGNQASKPELAQTTSDPDEASNFAAPDTEPANPTTYNPSFKCSDQNDNVLSMICESESLSQKDRTLSEAFKAALALVQGAQRQQLLNKQRGYLAERDSCQTEECIDAWYDRVTGVYESSEQSDANE